MQTDQPTRCSWAQGSLVEQAYHDHEWGVPTHDDQTLFEFLVLEGAQAGLSWRTILEKRKGYRQAFDYFDIQKIANYGETKIKELQNNPAIVRNKLKIRSVVSNAQAFIVIQHKHGSFANYIWSFVEQTPLVNSPQNASEVPAQTELSEQISRELKHQGFSFVGPTIVYSYMQAIGMVNDHTTDCFRYINNHN